MRPWPRSLPLWRKPDLLAASSRPGHTASSQNLHFCCLCWGVLSSDACKAAPQPVGVCLGVPLAEGFPLSSISLPGLPYPFTLTVIRKPAASRPTNGHNLPPYLLCPMPEGGPGTQEVLGVLLVGWKTLEADLCHGGDRQSLKLCCRRISKAWS